MTENLPMVSICMPCYNNSEFIEEAINSALNQTYANFKLIICDNQSDDGTWEIINKIDDPRLRIYRNATNIGMINNFKRVYSGIERRWL